MAGPRRRHGRGAQPEAGPLGTDIASFRLHLAAEGKAARTVQGYTSAVRWFAAAYLLRQAGKTSWEQVDAQDIQQWTVQLLARYSGAYASIQFRALRQFFKWRAAEEESPDPMARLRAPKVLVTAVPVFTSVELSELDKACQGRSFAARRDAAIIAVFTATGIRLSELAGICCHPGDPARSDLDLQAREIRIRGKGGTARTVKIGHQAARSLDRYLRARARHPQAHRPQLWLGVNNRGPLTATGIYQIVARRGRQCGVTVYPHRFRHPLCLMTVFDSHPRRASGPATCAAGLPLPRCRFFPSPRTGSGPNRTQRNRYTNPVNTASAERRHYFSHTWLDRGGAERDLMELNGWTSPQMLTRYGASARGARARRSYDRIMDDST